jgi:hypothetical protein
VSTRGQNTKGWLDTLRGRVGDNGSCGRFHGAVSPIVTLPDEVTAFDAA